MYLNQLSYLDFYMIKSCNKAAELREEKGKLRKQWSQGKYKVNMHDWSK